MFGWSGNAISLLCTCLLAKVFSQDVGECASSTLPSDTNITVNGTILRSPLNSAGTWYPPNTDEFWNVIGPTNFYVYLEFICNFNLQGFPGLCRDYINIKSSEFDQTYCSSMPAPVLIESNTATIRFHSDFAIENSGFVVRITFVANDTTVSSVECTSTDIQTRFDGGIIIRSPVRNALNRIYGPNTKSSSNVVAPSGYSLSVEFICEYGIQETDGFCSDYVHITSSSIGFDMKYCGSTPPSPFIVQSNELSVVFQSDSSIEDIGFVLKLTYVKSTETGASTLAKMATGGSTTASSFAGTPVDQTSSEITISEHASLTTTSGTSRGSTPAKTATRGSTTASSSTAHQMPSVMPTSERTSFTTTSGTTAASTPAKTTTPSSTTASNFTATPANQSSSSERTSLTTTSGTTAGSTPAKTSIQSSTTASNFTATSASQSSSSERTSLTTTSGASGTLLKSSLAVSVLSGFLLVMSTRAIYV